MKRSQLLSKTSKQDPADAKSVSHRLLLRGDFIDQLASGVYSLLPLGWRVYQKIENIIREEMDAIGGQELVLPSLQPKSIWERSGRWGEMDPPLFKVKDRHDKQLALGPTHEEVITDIVRTRISSYKQLPLALYQIQNKFRNEVRATGGLLRTREFVMKDLYSFHDSKESLQKFYDKVKEAYRRIFERMGLKIVWVQASSGTIGGKISHEAMVLSSEGEDEVLLCPECGFAANIEKESRSKCPECGAKLEVKKAIEAGHVFQLGTKYSEKMNAMYTDENGEQHPLIMGCYGLGLQRTMATIIEEWHDDKGMIWPLSVAPYQIALIGIGEDEEVQNTTEDIYEELMNEDYEVVWYNQKEKSVGEKFADADLLGFPYRLVISNKTLQKDNVEVKIRKTGQTKLVKKEKLISYIENEFSKL